MTETPNLDVVSDFAETIYAHKVAKSNPVGNTVVRCNNKALAGKKRRTD